MKSKQSLVKKINDYPGFTLVEFIVIMSIFVIMIGVVLFNFVGFRSAVTMENLVQDIALSIRQIQVSGGGSLSVKDAPGDEIRRGIYFTKNVEGGFSSTFHTFQDNLIENGLMDEGEEIDKIVIQTPDRIENILYGDNLAGLGDFTPIESNVGITFGRFDTFAEFSAENENFENAGYLAIEIRSPDPEKNPRYVIISKIGQVSIQ